MTPTDVPCYTRRSQRTMSRKTEANLDCVFVRNALIFIDPSIGGALTPPGPPCPTPLLQYAVHTPLSTLQQGLQREVKAKVIPE